MVGGTINDIELLYVEGIYKIYSVNVRGTGCEKNDMLSVKLKMTADETPHLRKGNSVWWHDKKAFLGKNEIKVEKIGNSFGHYHCLSKEKLQHLFASNGKTAKDFIKWAKSKNVKIHQSTISRQLSGKQGLTVAWELAYMAYFDSIKKHE